MKIGLIDVDGHNFPNLPLMKLSAYHKGIGDSVEWYDPMFGGHYDKVYMSKVFTFSPDYPYFINADAIQKGGTGYFYPDGGKPLPDCVKHIYPDYSLYYDKIPEVRHTAYGFLTRGCPRGCDFCIVGRKEGRYSQKVADLSEFWNGQKNICLLDPNFFACPDWRELGDQLINSKAWIDFSQGCDIRMMTSEKAEYLKKMKIKRIHFAWDRYEDKDLIVPKFKEFKEITQWDKRKLCVYVLTNFDTTLDQDLERIYTLRELGYWPYVMIYEKEKLPKGHVIRKLQRWVNARAIFETIPRFEDYQANA
jgi:hypothetical protein